MSELEKQLRERETKDLQTALQTDTLTTEAVDIARRILKERGDSIPDDITEKKKIEGISGWLILVGIGIVVSPLRIITQIFPAYSKIFSDGSWAALTTPGTKVYSPLWSPLLFGEMAINGGLVLAWLFVAFIFFSKKKEFPKWYIGILTFSLTFILLDAFVISAVLPGKPVFDVETSKEFFRALVVTLIWIPYMLISKRVKATFVN